MSAVDAAWLVLLIAMVGLAAGGFLALAGHVFRRLGALATGLLIGLVSLGGVLWCLQELMTLSK